MRNEVFEEANSYVECDVPPGTKINVYDTGLPWQPVRVLEGEQRGCAGELEVVNIDCSRERLSPD